MLGRLPPLVRCLVALQENMFIFGARADAVPRLRKERADFKPDERFLHVVNMIRTGQFGWADCEPEGGGPCQRALLVDLPGMQSLLPGSRRASTSIRQVRGRRVSPCSPGRWCTPWTCVRMLSG
jgi:hypothetical protein